MAIHANKDGLRTKLDLKKLTYTTSSVIQKI